MKLADDAPQPVEAAREAFENTARFPWYDEENDNLRPLELHSAPEARPIEADLGFLRPLAWGLLAVIVAALVVLAIFAYRRRTAGVARAPRDDDQRAGDRATVEALPFLADRSREDLLGQARRHYAQGNYSEAILYLFSYELVELDKTSLVRLARGKTNRQYVREASRKSPLGRPLELTMLAFEDVFFGRRVLDRAGFEACYRFLPEFEALAARGAT